MESQTLSNTLDELYRIAANERRRIIVGTLLQSDDDVTLAELVDAIIEREEGYYAHRAEFIETELKRRYLPKYADVGLVDFDPKREVVSPRAELERFEEILPDSYLD